MTEELIVKGIEIRDWPSGVIAELVLGSEALEWKHLRNGLENADQYNPEGGNLGIPMKLGDKITLEYQDLAFTVTLGKRFG